MSTAFRWLKLSNFYCNSPIFSFCKQISGIAIQNRTFNGHNGYQPFLKVNHSSIWRSHYVFESLERKSICRPIVRSRPISNSCLLWKQRDKKDRKAKLATAPIRDEGSEGEKTLTNIGTHYLKRYGDISFPDETTNEQIFDGVKFADLPIIHIHVSRNNTILTVSDAKGLSKCRWSCGMEGFKNAKKGTNIAAQSTAVTLGGRVTDLGMKNIRVKVKGLGPGRIAAIKGLTMGGLNVVSISDVTPIPFSNLPRPRKARR